MKRISSYLFIMIICLAACSKNTSSTGGGGVVIVPPVPADTILYQVMPFPVGASVSVNLMKTNTKYNGVVTKEYNSITAENAMKFGGLHPSENTYFWTDADYLVDYALANGKRVHGHILNSYT